MPKLKIHIAISKKRTGESYEELHKWIDNNEESEGVDHRSKNHFYTNELRKYVYSNFGGHKAVSEWLFHIALDNLDTSVTNDWMHKISDENFNKFGFKGNGFIYYESNEFNESDFEEEFSYGAEGY